MRQTDGVGCVAPCTELSFNVPSVCQVWPDNWGYHKALESIKASLYALGIGYIDLMLLHAPGDPHTRSETWKACEEAVAKASGGCGGRAQAQAGGCLPVGAAAG